MKGDLELDLSWDLPQPLQLLVTELKDEAQEGCEDWAGVPKASADLGLSPQVWSQ